MASHKLGLDIPDTMNSCILRIVDLSHYDDNISISCPKIHIVVPGYTNVILIEDITKNFSLNLTACDMGIQATKCGSEFNSLPDLVYVIKYSVSPEDQVFVEYNHLRITKALTKLKQVYCDLDLLNCTPSDTVKKKHEQARLIWEYLFAAKAHVEQCRQVDKGIALYKEALRLLDKLDCKTCN